MSGFRWDWERLVITDTGTGTTTRSERIGEIYLDGRSSGAGASGVTLASGATTPTPVGGKVTIVLTDVDHVTSVPAANPATGVHHLTTAQYEALVANPTPKAARTSPSPSAPPAMRWTVRARSSMRRAPRGPGDHRRCAGGDRWRDAGDQPD